MQLYKVCIMFYCSSLFSWIFNLTVKNGLCFLAVLDDIISFLEVYFHRKLSAVNFWAFRLFALNLGKNWSFPVTAFAWSGLFGGHAVLITFGCSLPNRFLIKSLAYWKGFNPFSDLWWAVWKRSEDLPHYQAHWVSLHTFVWHDSAVFCSFCKVHVDLLIYWIIKVWTFLL